MLSQNLKIFRKKCGFTQKVIADSLNIDRSTYTYYETGESSPTIETLCKLSKIFNVTIDDLVTRPASAFSNNCLLNDNPPIYRSRTSGQEGVTAMGMLNTDEKKLIIDYRQLPESQKREIAKMISGFLRHQED